MEKLDGKIQGVKMGLEKYKDIKTLLEYHIPISKTGDMYPPDSMEWRIYPIIGKDELPIWKVEVIEYDDKFEEETIFFKIGKIVYCYNLIEDSFWYDNGEVEGYERFEKYNVKILYFLGMLDWIGTEGKEVEPEILFMLILCCVACTSEQFNMIMSNVDHLAIMDFVKEETGMDTDLLIDWINNVYDKRNI